MASSSLPAASSCALIKPYIKQNSHRAMKVRAHCYGDEGRSSSHIVDANLSVLRRRIEEIRVKQKLERCYGCKYGWNYTPGYNYKLKKERDFFECLKLAGIVGGTFSIVCFSGTVFLSLVSILVHLNQ